MTNIVSLQGLKSTDDLDTAIIALQDILDRGYQDIVVDATYVDAVYPIAAVPFGCLIDHIKSKRNITFITDNCRDYFEKCHAMYPVDYTKVSDGDNTLDRLIRFRASESDSESSTDVYGLTDRITSSIMARIECAPGVSHCMKYLVYEIMDNIILHSNTDYGYIMAQVHGNGKAVICIADQGVGIFNSLRPTKYKPKNAVDAIELAMRENVTRGVGQGNGLFYLVRIMRNNSGFMTIGSGSGVVSLIDGQFKTHSHRRYYDRNCNGTYVEMQFSCAKDIDRNEIWDDPEDPILINNTAGTEDVNIILLESSSGVATRQAAQELRTYIKSQLNSGVQTVNIDFTGIGIISSSFADELLGKLIMDIGLMTYMRSITVTGADTFISSIIDQSVAKRIRANVE